MAIYARIIAENTQYTCLLVDSVVILQMQNFNDLMKSNDIRREWRFYTCLFLGFFLLVAGFYVPPMGMIDNSVIIASGIILCIGAMAVGVDLKGCIRELRLLQSNTPVTDDEDGK